MSYWIVEHNSHNHGTQYSSAETLMWLEYGSIFVEPCRKQSDLILIVKRFFVLTEPKIMKKNPLARHTNAIIFM